LLRAHRDRGKRLPAGAILAMAGDLPGGYRVTRANDGQRQAGVQVGSCEMSEEVLVMQRRCADYPGYANPEPEDIQPCLGMLNATKGGVLTGTEIRGERTTQRSGGRDEVATAVAGSAIR